MANNYLQFSEVLTIKSAEEKDWLQVELDKALEEPSLSGLSWEFEDDGLWLYAEEYADVEALAFFVQAFLAHFKREDYWTLSYAETCSKPRLSEFSGGAVFVTGEEVKFWSAWDFLCDRIKEHNS